MVNAVAVANAVDRIKAEDHDERIAMLRRHQLCKDIGLTQSQITELVQVVEKARSERYLLSLLDR